MALFAEDQQHINSAATTHSCQQQLHGAHPEVLSADIFRGVEADFVSLFVGGDHLKSVAGKLKFHV